MPAKSAPAVPPEAIATVAQHTVAKLSERATGRLVYWVGFGASGVAYLSVVDNEGGGYFSKEPVPLHKIQTVLANPLATGEPFATSLLRRAFVSRSNNNGCFLAAVLRHEGLLKPAETPNRHVCSGDWDSWADNQRHRLAKAGPARAKESSAPMPEPVPELPTADDAPEPVEAPIQEVLGLAASEGTGTEGELDREEIPEVEDAGEDRTPTPGGRPGKAARGSGGGRHADR
jgi:hypothetical protein